MHFTLTSLLPLTLTLYRIHADAVPRPTQLNFSDLPPEINNGIFGNADLVAYVTVLGTTGGAPLVTPEVEEKLLVDAAEEVKHLDIYNDNQRARLSAIREATRAIIKQRSTLPTTIDPDTDISILKDLAAQFESSFLEHASLSCSPTWVKYCMAALLGKDTLIRLLPFVSEGFFNKHNLLMTQAAAVIGDFDTFHAVANHSKLSSYELEWYIENDILFSGSVEFVQKIATLFPSFIPNWSASLSESILLNHRLLFEYLYDETMKQPLEPWELKWTLIWAFEAISSRGWEDLFKQLYSKHSHRLNIEGCLMSAAAHGHIEILKYILFHNANLAKKAKAHLFSAFEAAVGSGSIDAINFLLDHDKTQNPLIPNLSLTQPSQSILKRVGESGRWDGIEYLIELKGHDIRFEKFKLAGNANEAVATACLHGHLRTLTWLLQKDSQGRFVFSIGKKGLRQALKDACHHGHLPIVQELLKDPKVNPAFSCNQPLIAACWYGNHLIVRELLQHERVNPSAKGGDSLISACRQGHLLVVRELLQQHDGQYIYDVDPAVRNNWALITACKKGSLLVVRELLQHERVDPSANDGEPLIMACRKGHLLVVQELLQRGADGKYIYAGVNPAARNNQCLIGACQYGRSKVVECLLQGRLTANGVIEYEHFGIDVTAQDNMALLKAIENQHIGVVELLLRKTEQGEYLFPGIAITEMMRQKAAGNDELRKLLD